MDILELDVRQLNKVLFTVDEDKFMESLPRDNLLGECRVITGTVAQIFQNENIISIERGKNDIKTFRYVPTTYVVEPEEKVTLLEKGDKVTILYLWNTKTVVTILCGEYVERCKDVPSGDSCFCLLYEAIHMIIKFDVHEFINIADLPNPPQTHIESVPSFKSELVNASPVAFEKILESRHTPIENVEVDPYGSVDTMELYESLKKNGKLSVEQIEVCETIKKNSSSSRQEKNDHRIFNIISVDQYDNRPYKHIVPSMFSLKKHYPEGISQLCDIINNTQKGPNIVLSGGDNYIREAIVEELSVILDVPYTSVDLSAVSTVIDVNGSSYKYDSSEPGCLEKALVKLHTTRAIIFCKGFNHCKNLPGSNGDLLSPFTSIIQDQILCDAFTNYNHDVSNTIFVFETPSLDELEPGILRLLNTNSVCVDKLSMTSMHDIVDKEFNCISKECRETIIKLSLPQTEKVLERNAKLIALKLGNSQLVSEKIADSLIAGYNEPMVKAFAKNVLANCYDPDVEERIRFLYDEYTTEDDLLKRKQLEQELKLMIGLLQHPLTIEFDQDAFRTSLDETHYGMDAIKDMISCELCSALKFNQFFSPMIINGPPGTGKTSLLRTCCNNLGIGCIVVPGDGQALLQSRPSSLGGTNPSKLSESLLNYIDETNYAFQHILVIIDEFDKCIDELGGFFSLLDGNRTLNDAFFGETFKAYNLMFVFTSNSINRIAEPIRNRCIEYTVNDYSSKEKENILREFTLRKFENDYGVSIEIDSKVFSNICQSISSTGLRHQETALLSCIKHALTRVKSYKNVSKVCVCKEDLDFALRIYETQSRIGF